MAKLSSQIPPNSTKIKKDGKIGEDRRRVHANSRVQDVSNSTEFIPISHLYTN